MGERPPGRDPVADWATDFDHLTEEWAAQGPEILTELRDRCPVPHTERFHGAYIATRYDDVVAVAQDPATFSSRVTMVTDLHPDEVRLSLGPLTLDPPLHAPLRRALLPTFNPKRVVELQPLMAGIVEELLDDLAGRDVVDGAAEFAELVPIRLMSHLFGVPPSRGLEFKGWVNGILKDGLLDVRIAREANRAAQAYFAEALRTRVEQDEWKPDLVSTVLDARVTEDDGSIRPLTEREQIGSLYVLLIGGIDTTWSLIGAALLHLGTHADDLARLVAEPDLVPVAIEEFLRFYSPATVGRVISEDAVVGGCPVAGGERLLLSFPSANRDESRFDRADEVVLDRRQNRHIAFGVGIHRCIGSNLARAETEVALRAWLQRFPRFELAADPAEIRWSNGAVRGPHNLPLRLLAPEARS